jgi:hypothetical protein
MDQQTDTDLDQADEQILTYTVSDEALEAAAGAEGGAGTLNFNQCASVSVCG